MIDLRTDAVTPPTEAMWSAMRSARMGWASARDDGNLAVLEQRGAELLGKEACVLLPTCSLANLVALLALTQPGDRVLVEPDAHIVVNEGDWLTHVARLHVGEPASVICIENTHTRRGGTIVDAAETTELVSRAPRSHLDGARLANAAVALGVPLAELTGPVDTVALSLNKGLGAPFGALLAGDETTIADARIHAKRLGGATVHKAGLFAAAALVALDDIPRLAEDHRRARELARLIGAPEPQTNIVFCDADVDALAERGVLALAMSGKARFATHRGITDDDVVRAAEAIVAVVGSCQL